jgi:uncharacterized repeat protein (TIGR01451 family)
MVSAQVWNMRLACQHGHQRGLRAHWALRAFLLLRLLAAGNAAADGIQGQSWGNPNWFSGDVTGWQELNYIPTRVLLTGGPVTGRVVTISFQHTTKSFAPEIQLLTGFTPSANVVITSGPTLSCAPTMSIWTYSLTVNLLDNNPGEIVFSSRLSAGAHRNANGLIQDSASALLIPQPAAAPGSPDLAIVRAGPASVSPGNTMTCTLNYTNQSGTSPATGVQITEILPAQVTCVPGSAEGAVLVGNTLTWDLGNLNPGAIGSVRYQMEVNTNAPAGQSFTDTAMILSAENDANPADNTTTNTVMVVPDCQPPAITGNPLGATNCAGASMSFSVSASGAPPLSFQWRKDGAPIPGATQSCYTLSAPCGADAGPYDVIVTNDCGSVSSDVAVLGIWQPISSAQMLSPASFQIEFASLSNRLYSVQYSANLICWTTVPTGITGTGNSVQWADTGPPNTVCAPSAATMRFYRVVLVR